MTGPGPDLAYDGDALQSGGNNAHAAAEAAEHALTRLQAARVRAGAFGDFTGSARAATGVGATRDTFARTAHHVHAHHLALHTRAHDTAAQGEQLVAHTTAIARRADPGPISDGPISDAMDGPAPR